jgi:peptidoglycan/LPS O-acetylase OafA/YrhL
MQFSLDGLLLPFEVIKKFGYAGVDIFFLLSGVGISFSLSKKPSLWTFISCRFVRILPTFWFSLVLFLIFELISGQLDIYLRLLSFIGADFILEGNSELWYISSIMLCYLLSPALFRLLSGVNSNLGFVITILFFIAVSIMVSYLYPSLLIFTSRIPVYIFGLYVGIQLFNNKNIPYLNSLKANIIVLLFLSLSMVTVFVLLDSDIRKFTGIQWYITSLFAYPISYILCTLFEFKLISLIRPALKVVGDLSLEIYLLHILVFKVGETYSWWDGNPIVKYSFYLAASILLSYLLNKLIKLAIK